jgi:hypothetical protein
LFLLFGGGIGVVFVVWWWYWSCFCWFRCLSSLMVEFLLFLLFGGGID